MPKFLSCLAHVYPFLFLALVICGPVLLLPHTLPVFLFLAGLDCLLTAVFSVIWAGFCGLHLALPATFKQITAEAAERILGQTRFQKLVFFLHRAAHLSSIALMVLTSHPYFATVGLVGYVVALLFRRLIASAHGSRL